MTRNQLITHLIGAHDAGLKVVSRDTASHLADVHEASHAAGTFAYGQAHDEHESAGLDRIAAALAMRASATARGEDDGVVVPRPRPIRMRPAGTRPAVPMRPGPRRPS